MFMTLVSARLLADEKKKRACVCVCIPILVTTFPEFLSDTEPLPPCVRPRCVCSVLRAHAQFCRFDLKGGRHRRCSVTLQSPSATLIPVFSAQSSLDADILVYWIGKIVRTCVPGGSRTLDFLRARRAPEHPIH